MKHENPFLIIAIFSVLITIVISTDGDCRRQVNPTANNCQSVDTGTPNICCFAQYKKTDGTEVKQCITLDGTSPHYLLQSQKNIKKTFPGNDIDKIIMCDGKAEECENSLATNFDSCNGVSTKLRDPFQCCLIEVAATPPKPSYCYPVNAKYNTTVAAFADELKLLNSYETAPKITCSKTPLPPPPSSGAFLYINYSLIAISIFLQFLM